ncbi:hypothetical protein [Streptomyces sp. NPDC048508]|uniref:hypothetical protein n=1 Tax=Streptomyces sp. NPDC048508 TaxID=3365561 RepID=UPI0037192C0A
MSTEIDGQPFFEDSNAVLREIAQNPAAFAHYLADFNRVVLDMQARLEILQREARVHCRGTRVEGDSWGQAFLRSFPVESSLQDVLKNLKRVAAGLERSANRRYAHDEKVKEVTKIRSKKAQLKVRRNNPALQATPECPVKHSTHDSALGHGVPTSIYDLSHRESA